MSDQKEVDVWELSDLRTPWCLYVVVTLHIAEKIDAGINNIAELAMVSSCDQTALHAVLGHLAGRGIFQEPKPGYFNMNQAARQLLDPVIRLSLDLEDIGGRFAHAWGTLFDYVRTGQPAYQKVFGLPFWEDLIAHPQLAASFDTLIGMAGHGTPNPEFQITGG